VRSWLFTSALCHSMDWGALQVLHTPTLNFCTILHQINSKTPAMEEYIMVYIYLISIREILAVHICPMSSHGLGCTASSTHSDTQFLHNLHYSNYKKSTMEKLIMVLDTSSQLIELWKSPRLCQSTQWSITAFLCLWSPQPSKQRTLQHGRACTLPPTPPRTCSL
jgi:hypothetical protein